MPSQDTQEGGNCSIFCVCAIACKTCKTWVKNARKYSFPVIKWSKFDSVDDMCCNQMSRLTTAQKLVDEGDLSKLVQQMYPKPIRSTIWNSQKMFLQGHLPRPTLLFKHPHSLPNPWVALFTSPPPHLLAPVSPLLGDSLSSCNFDQLFSSERLTHQKTWQTACQ